MKSSVIFGTASAPGVVGTPGRAAYCTIERVEQSVIVDGPGITWELRKTPRTPGTGYWYYGLDGKEHFQYFFDGTGDFSPEYTLTPLYLGSTNLQGHPARVIEKKMVIVTKCYPEQQAVSSIPARPSTPNQIKQSLNKGWNSFARSINKLEAGSCVEITVANGITGAFIGAGEKTLIGNGINVLKHGLIIDPSGVKVYETGAEVATLRPSANATSRIRIHRQPDNSIIYVIITGTDVRFYSSGVSPISGDLYIHAYLYSGGDQILTAEFITAKVVFGETA